MPKRHLQREREALRRWNSKQYKFFRDIQKPSVRPRRSEKTPSTNIGKFGKLFVTSFPKTVLQESKRRRSKRGYRFMTAIAQSYFESPVSVALIEDKKIDLASPTVLSLRRQKIAEARVNFDKDAVRVEAINTLGKMRSELSRFRAIHGKLWSNHLIEQIEAHARKSGFKQVKIRRPENLYYYQYPVTKAISGDLKRIETQLVQKNMRNLYYTLAENMGYRVEGDFFVKDLS